MISQSTAPLRSRLVEQAASDLAENRRRQQDLATRITVLQREESLLTDILGLAREYEGFADPSRLPEQVQDEPALTVERVPAATGAVARVTGPGRTSAGSGRAEASAKGKSRRPLLGELLLELLAGHDEPRLAKELRVDLLAKHPERNPTPQVVRNTLESLVAKGRIQRHKQQRSVMYTLVQPAAVG